MYKVIEDFSYVVSKTTFEFWNCRLAKLRFKEITPTILDILSPLRYKIARSNACIHVRCLHKSEYYKLDRPKNQALYF